MEMFVACAPGVEAILAREIAAVGLVPKIHSGGVTCSGHDTDIYALNLHLRTAGRVLVRLGTFEARSFAQLEQNMRTLALGGRVDVHKPLAIRVTCRKSKLYHTKAVSERITQALCEELQRDVALTCAPSNLDEDEAPPPTLLVRIENDLCTISLDTSGAHLHKRGYRALSAKAPIRETLAAALLMMSGYDGTQAFVDPMCGSGTIAIEAALIAGDVAPGLGRTFAFEEWPCFDAEAYHRMRARALEHRKSGVPAIVASDRDSGATQAARVNAERAGVKIEVEQRPLSKTQPPAATGLLLTNPPYGARIGDVRALRDLYAAIGNLARGPFARWTCGLVTPDENLAHAARGFTSASPLIAHGGLKIKLYLSPASTSERP